MNGILVGFSFVSFPDNPNKGREDDVLGCVLISVVVELLCFYALNVFSSVS